MRTCQRGVGGMYEKVYERECKRGSVGDGCTGVLMYLIV